MARTPAKMAPDPASGLAPIGADEPGSYTVVARRYRPQRFEDVVGQNHVVRALRNAIQMDRVAQAYLFCGTRGVGKTSLARIFAKCLNCATRGPTVDPCLECDICLAIAVGQDVDVIEIDGASNNGVEAVRELRQNAGLRPSRARFKIYYIDEVHMLSTGAFNALLKTLEEPPGHVKFFFATTEANKIPITVVSRCQRFDLAGIAPEPIAETLAAIAAREGVEADADALRVVARRASGSMRDAQSLLEQLLSSGDGRLTVESVHRLLGTASDDRTLDLLDALSRREPGAALTILDRAVLSGVQPADLLGGALEFLRDAMLLAVGADAAMLAASPRQHDRLKGLADRWGLDTTLAALQILAEARGRLRGSPHGRLLVELALAKVARLEDLDELGQLVSRLSALESGAPAPRPRAVESQPAAPEKKKPEPGPAPEPVGPADDPPPGPGPVADPTPERLELSRVLEVWPTLAQRTGPAKLPFQLATALTQVRPTAVDPPDSLVVPLGASYNWIAESPEAASRIASALEPLLSRRPRIRFVPTVAAPATEAPDPKAPAEPMRAAWEDNPMVRQVVQLFEARPIRVELEDEE